MSENLSLSDASDVVASDPARLGFPPHDDLVALWTDPNGRLLCLMRVDLDIAAAELCAQPSAMSRLQASP